jgi:DGQHR domain-containing protein
MNSITEKSPTEAPSLAEEIIEQKRKNREALEYLLKDALQASGQKVALTAQMAGTESYLMSAPLNWVANEMSFARELPLFKKMEDEEGNLQIDERTIHEIVQRPLDWTRQLPLTIYIAGRKWHKFPVITAVLTEPWVDDPSAPEWEKDGNGDLRAQQDSTRFDPLDPEGRIGLLSLQGASLYALDGQHRLIGLRGVAELLKTGKIEARNRKGEAKPGQSYTLEQLSEQYQFETNGLEKLNSELIGLEVIPAVKQGETREEARRRVRSIFTHVNKTAVKLNAGQIAQLDEDNGFAIVGRWAAVDHPLLKMNSARSARPRVNWQNATIPAKSTVLTTLQTVTEMAGEYLKDRKEYHGWMSSGDMRGLIPVRPTDDELEKGLKEFKEFLTAFQSLPSVSELDRGKTTQEFRNFADKEVNDPPGQAHLLFRPIGQIALAEAVGILVKDGRDLNELFELLKVYEEEGGFSIDKVANPWWGVVYDPTGKKIARGGHEGPRQILLYLLGGLNGPEHKEDRDALLDRLIRARMIDEEGKAVRNYDNQDVAPEQFRLPAVIS